MNRFKRSHLKPVLRKYPPLAIVYAWLCAFVILPICTPGILVMEDWSEVKKLYSEVIPIMFWYVEG